MCLQEFLNPFCEEAENSFFQAFPVIEKWEHMDTERGVLITGVYWGENGRASGSGRSRGIDWGEMPNVGEGEKKSKAHCHVCTYATVLHALLMYPNTYNPIKNKEKKKRNNSKSPSKTQNERICQTALLGVCLTKWVESAFRIREWEARVFWELRLDIAEWMGVNAVLRNICF